MAGLVSLSGDNPIRSIGKSPVDNGKGSTKLEKRRPGYRSNCDIQSQWYNSIIAYPDHYGDSSYTINAGFLALLPFFQPPTILHSQTFF
jgi:hypothetical protein